MAEELTGRDLQVLRSLNDQVKELRRISRRSYNHQHPVEEYQGSATLPANQVIVQPNYQMRERIESILVSLPPGITSASLQLADRTVPLYASGPNTAAVANSGIFAAGVAGNVPLPAGASMTGFDVTVQGAAALATGVVTVTNLAAGNLNYELDETTSGQDLTIRFPNPLPAANAAATPQVNVPAIGGGAAYAITVYGLSGQAPTTSQQLINIQNAGFILGEDDERFLTYAGTPAGSFFVGLYGHALEEAQQR